MLKYLIQIIILIIRINTNTINNTIIQHPKNKDLPLTDESIMDNPIGKIIIEKININNNLYHPSSNKNNIEKNVTILKGSNLLNQNIIFLAAHSGYGKIAYFKNLNNLKINDEVKLILNKKESKYYVTKIWETEKNGNIKISYNNSKEILILTTCSPTNSDKQLIIQCEKKEP